MAIDTENKRRAKLGPIPILPSPDGVVTNRDRAAKVRQYFMVPPFAGAGIVRVISVGHNVFGMKVGRMGFERTIAGNMRLENTRFGGRSRL